jgi:histidinol phosphatase-like PHP family hydrolase
VEFAINSDAHRLDALGDMRDTPQIVTAAGLPIGRIVNVSDGTD